MIIVGITGTLGAGKGTIVDYLINKYHYSHFSVRDYLTQELIKSNRLVNRDTMTELANQLRAENSPSFIVEQLFDQALKIGKNCIIESIRTPGEVISLRSKGNFKLFAVDADPQIRYERIKIRNSSTDQVSFETFIENERREMSSTDPNKQNISWCIEHADFKFKNNNNKELLYHQVEDIIKIIQG